jgi:phosphoglycolate phosphatase
MSKDTVLYADTVNTLRRLKRNGLNTGIVTTKSHFRIVETLNMHSTLDLEPIRKVSNAYRKVTIGL